MGNILSLKISACQWSLDVILICGLVNFKAIVTMNFWAQKQHFQRSLNYYFYLWSTHTTIIARYFKLFHFWKKNFFAMKLVKYHFYCQKRECMSCLHAYCTLYTKNIRTWRICKTKSRFECKFSQFDSF